VTRYAGAGCALCAVAEVRPAGRLERLVRAGVAAVAMAYPTGWVAAQYVNVEYMSLLWPVVLGLAVSWAASAAAGRRGRGDEPGILVAAATGALLGTALGFRIFDIPVTPLEPFHVVWGPYLAALAGVLIWPLMFGVPRPVTDETQGTAANR
jgi:hypothetical protein